MSQIAAIYARYSSDKQSESSINDQRRNCLRVIKANGWGLIETYRDEAISGSRTDRPDYQRMLSDAEKKAFNTLVVDDLSRLSRDDVEMKQVIRRFKFWGIRIVSASDGFDSDQKGYKIQADFRSLMNEMYLDDLREKTHRGLVGKAQQGNSCGGKSYGYKPKPIFDATRKDEFGRPLIAEVKREIDHKQAKWVRWIFQHYADGWSPRKMAAELNRIGVPSPRGKTWAASAIHGDSTEGTGILNNPLYQGRYIWNRREWIKNPDNGRRVYLARPQSDWIITDMPELRIIDEALWQRVQERQAERKNINLSLATKGRRLGGAKYLLSSLLKCGECGANYIMTDYYRYQCAKHHDRGAHVCKNSFKVKRKDMEHILLQSISQDLFTDECIEMFKQEIRKLIKERAAKRDDTARTRKAILTNEKAIANMINAIKAGIVTETTKAELEALESEKEALERSLQKPDDKLTDIEQGMPRLVRDYQKFVSGLVDLPENKIPKARTYLQEVVGGEIILRPTEDGLKAELYGALAGLITVSGLKCKKELVAGAGFEPTTFRL